MKIFVQNIPVALAVHVGTRVCDFASDLQHNINFIKFIMVINEVPQTANVVMCRHSSGVPGRFATIIVQKYDK